MKLDIIREMNAFDSYAEASMLSAGATLLWYRLISLHNRAFHPDALYISNCRLASLIATYNIKTATAARDELVRNGILIYEKGSKSAPGKYILNSVADMIFRKKDMKSDNISGTENYAGSDVESDVENGFENGVRKDIYNIYNNKNKIKNKTKTNTHFTARVCEKNAIGSCSEKCAENENKSITEADVLFDRFRSAYPEERDHNDANSEFT